MREEPEPGSGTSTLQRGVIAFGAIGLVTMLLVGFAAPVKDEGIRCGSAIIADDDVVEELRQRADDSRAQARTAPAPELAAGFEQVARDSDNLIPLIEEGCSDARQDRATYLIIGAMVSALVIAAGFFLLSN